jgi:hypothetical protein
MSPQVYIYADALPRNRIVAFLLTNSHPVSYDTTIVAEATLIPCRFMYTKRLPIAKIQIWFFIKLLQFYIWVAPNGYGICVS